MFLLDSNVYIASFNDAAFGEGFRAFHRSQLPRIVLSAVVVHELLVGARDQRRERLLRRGIIEPFRARRRIHVPGLRACELAAELDRRLRARGGLAASLAQRSFANDLLIAVSAREIGATIITRNLADFALVRRVIDVRYEAPWPMPVAEQLRSAARRCP
jgi:predicted nucleic acid-binding protein